MTVERANYSLMWFVFPLIWQVKKVTIGLGENRLKSFAKEILTKCSLIKQEDSHSIWLFSQLYTSKTFSHWSGLSVRKWTIQQFLYITLPINKFFKNSSKKGNTGIPIGENFGSRLKQWKMFPFKKSPS